MSPNQAKDILLRLIANYPGLLDVRGADGAEVVEWISNELVFLLPDSELEYFYFHGTPNNYRGPYDSRT